MGLIINLIILLILITTSIYASNSEKSNIQFECDFDYEYSVEESPWKGKSLILNQSHNNSISATLYDNYAESNDKEKLISFGKVFRQNYYVCDQPMISIIPFENQCPSYNEEIYLTKFEIYKTSSKVVLVKYQLRPNTLYLKYFGLIKEPTEKIIPCFKID